MRRTPLEPWSYRKMVEADLDAVLAISRASFHSSWSKDLFLRELAHEWSTVLLAEREGKKGTPSQILGFMVCWRVQDELHILNLATHPDARRSGVAKGLLEKALASSKQAGGALATLEVRKSNAPAQALYRHFGFEQVGIRPNYYVEEGEDAVVMVLRF